MKVIDITTSHNIVVRYELATLLQRILSTIIDMGIMVFITLVLSFIFGVLELFSVLTVLVFLVFVFYHLLFEMFYGGQTIGKKLLNIQVINFQGKSPNPNEVLQRWVYRIIDITLSFGTLAAIYITTSSNNQRIGDLMAGTSVIKKRPEKLVSLKHVDRINERNHEVAYPEIKVYEEQRILFIKETLDRHRNHPNDSTRKVLSQLAIKIQEDLNIDQKNRNNVDFLSTLIKDYVALTR